MLVFVVVVVVVGPFFFVVVVALFDVVPAVSAPARPDSPYVAAQRIQRRERAHSEPARVAERPRAAERRSQSEPRSVL